MRAARLIALAAALAAAPLAAGSAADAIDIADRGDGYFSVVGPMGAGPDGYFHVYCAAARAAERRGLRHVALLSALLGQEGPGAAVLETEFFASSSAAEADRAGSAHPAATTDAMIAAYCPR